MTLTKTEVSHLVETLKDCKIEFEELMRSEEWFITDIVDDIEICLTILQKEQR